MVKKADRKRAEDAHGGQQNLYPTHKDAGRGLIADRLPTFSGLLAWCCMAREAALGSRL